MISILIIFGILLFAFVKLRDATTAPVVGEIVSVPSALDTDDTAAPPPTQTPETA